MKMTLPPRFCASICLPAARAISQDWVTLTSMTSMNVFRRLIDDFLHLVDARGEHHDIDAAEALHRGFDDLVAVRRRARPHVDGLDLGAELLAIGRDLFQRLGAARRQHDIAAGAGQHLRRERAERAGGAGDDRGLAFDVE